jgi:hypothetical protein
MTPLLQVMHCNMLHNTAADYTFTCSILIVLSLFAVEGQQIGENKHFGDAGAKLGSDSHPVIVPSIIGPQSGIEGS